MPKRKLESNEPQRKRPYALQSSLQMGIVNLYNYLKKEAEAENVCIYKANHCAKLQ